MAKILAVVMLLPCVLANNASTNASTNTSTNTSTNMSTSTSTNTSTNMSTNTSSSPAPASTNSTASTGSTSSSSNTSASTGSTASTDSSGSTGTNSSTSSSANTSAPTSNTASTDSTSSSSNTSSSSSSTSSSSNASSGASSTSTNSSSSSNTSSIITSTGDFSLTMSKAHATALTSDPAAAKDIFKKAMAATLDGVTASEITIKRIYVDGVLVNGTRRLSSQSTPSVNATTNSSSTDATVLVEWEINSATAVTADSAIASGDSFKNAIVSEALKAGVTIVIKEITVTVATTTAAPTGKVGASGCMEWSVRTGLASVMLAFFTFA